MCSVSTYPQSSQSEDLLLFLAFWRMHFSLSCWSLAKVVHLIPAFIRPQALIDFPNVHRYSCFRAPKLWIHNVKEKLYRRGTLLSESSEWGSERVAAAVIPKEDVGSQKIDAFEDQYWREFGSQQCN